MGSDIIGLDVNGYNPYKMRNEYAIKKLFKDEKKDTELNTGYFLLKFMDIPGRLVKKVEFLGEYKLLITFKETAEFSVEMFVKRNFDVMTGKKLTIEYLNKEGSVLRTDTYTVSKIGEIFKSTLDIEEEKPLEIKITFECTNHDISTCKK